MGLAPKGDDDTYDLSIPLVNPAGGGDSALPLATEFKFAFFDELELSKLPTPIDADINAIVLITEGISSVR